MKRFMNVFVIGCCLLALTVVPAAASGKAAAKPSPDATVAMLKAGNVRFVEGKATHPHADAARLKLAGSKNQGDYAYATVITCSDSRVPVEIVFDAGVMDIFVIRVAGNVCDVDTCVTWMSAGRSNTAWPT